MPDLDEEVFKDPFDKKKKASDPFFDGVDIELGSPPQNVAPVQQQVRDDEPMQIGGEQDFGGIDLYDPIEGPQPDPLNEPIYRDVLEFQQHYKNVNSELSDFNARKTSANERYDNFFDDKLPSAYKEYTSFEAPPTTRSNRHELLETIENEFKAKEDRIAEGDTSWFGEDEDYQQALEYVTPERKKFVQGLRQEHDRLLAERDEYDRRAYEKRQERDRLMEYRTRIPNIVRAEAEEWAKLERARIKDLRDGTKKRRTEQELFEIEDYLDKKIADIDPWNGALDKSHMSLAERRRYRKGIENLLGHRREERGYRAQGGITSWRGNYDGHPIGITGAEREVLDVNALKNIGVTSYKGQPIEEYLESVGGEDRVNALTAISSILKSHNLYTQVGIDYWKDWGKPGHEKREKAFEIAQSSVQKAISNGVAMGLENEIVHRNNTGTWWDHLINAKDRGVERASGTPRNIFRILGKDGGIDKSAISKLIESARAEAQSPRSKDYENYMASLQKKGGSTGVLDALKHLFDEDGWDGKAIMVIGELFTESMSSLIPAVGRNLMDTGPLALGLGVAEFLLTKKPNKTLRKILGRNVKTAITASFGLASFQLSYMGKILEDMGELGVDVNNPDHFLSAWNNPEIVARLRKRATSYAGGVALFDTLSAGFISNIGRITQGVSRRLGTTSLGRTVLTPAFQASASIGADASMGMAGEFAGYWLSKEPGEKVPYDEIMLEGVAEIPLGVGGAVGRAGLNFSTPAIKKFWESTTPRKRKTLSLRRTKVLAV